MQKLIYDYVSTIHLLVRSCFLLKKKRSIVKKRYNQRTQISNKRAYNTEIQIITYNLEMGECISKYKLPETH